MDPLVADLAQNVLLSVLLATPRLLMFMFIMPIFASVVFPRLLRSAIAIGLGAPVAFGLYHQVGNTSQSVDLLPIVLKECVLGLLLGLALAAPLWTLLAVGSLTDNQRGANAAQQVTPFAQADASLLGGALQQALVVVLAAGGGLSMMYQLLLLSYEAWPVLELVPDAAQFGFELASFRFGEFLQLALLYAAPMIAIVLLVDFAFALMSVFAPQLQTYFAAMPLKGMAAIVVLALYVSVLLSHGDGYFRDVLRREADFLQTVVERRQP